MSLSTYGVVCGSHDGWLRRLGMVDMAGGGPVHLLGGVTGLVATIMLKPRLGHFGRDAEQTRMACPTNALLGMFMLWLARHFIVDGRTSLTKSSLEYA